MKATSNSTQRWLTVLSLAALALAACGTRQSEAQRSVEDLFPKAYVRALWDCSSTLRGVGETWQADTLRRYLEPALTIPLELYSVDGKYYLVDKDWASYIDPGELGRKPEGLGRALRACAQHDSDPSSVLLEIVKELP